MKKISPRPHYLSGQSQSIDSPRLHIPLLLNSKGEEDLSHLDKQPRSQDLKRRKKIPRKRLCWGGVG